MVTLFLLRLLDERPVVAAAADALRLGTARRTRVVLSSSKSSTKANKSLYLKKKKTSMYHFAQCRSITVPENYRVALATAVIFNPFSAGIDFRRQNLTSVDVRI